MLEQLEVIEETLEYIEVGSLSYLKRFILSGDGMDRDFFGTEDFYDFSGTASPRTGGSRGALCFLGLGTLVTSKLAHWSHPSCTIFG